MTRSVLQLAQVKRRNEKRVSNNGQLSQEQYEYLRSLRLRYFSPEELLRIHAYKPPYALPSDMSTRTQYKLIGNSINCFVLAKVIDYLLKEPVDS